MSQNGISRRHFLLGALLAGVAPAAGFGSTPSLKALGYRADIELEYAPPQGSDTVTEVSRCLEYCKKALA
jgi:hypothetical protein